MLETARAILDRGDCVLIFPEGTRIRPGRARPPEARRRPPRARDRRAGRPGRRHRHRGGPQGLAHPPAQGPHPRRPPAHASRRSRSASPQLAAAVTDRIWPCVMLQWEWLGGLPPLRRAAVIGAGSWGTSIAVMLARAGLEVELGMPHARAGRASSPPTRAQRALPARRRAARRRARRRAPRDLELSRHDLVCFAVPAAALPAAVAAHGGAIPPRAGVLVLSKGLVPPLGTLPAAYVAERVHAWAVAGLGGPAHAEAALDGRRLARRRRARTPRSPARSATRSPRPASTSPPASDVHRRRARRRRQERRRAGRRRRRRRRPERRRRRRRQGLRRGRRLRAPRAAAARDVRRPRRRRRPRRHRPRQRLPQPPRRRAARPRHRRRRDRRRARPDRRGGRLRPAARRARARRRASTRPCSARLAGADRGPRRARAGSPHR